VFRHPTARLQPQTDQGDVVTPLRERDSKPAMTLRLCDGDGMVSHAPVEDDTGDESYLARLNRLRAMSGHGRYEGQPFTCTGDAHLAGAHILCDSKAHRADPTPSARVKINADGYRLVRIAKEFREWLADAPDDDEQVASLRDDIAAIDRIGRWLAAATPIDASGRGRTAP
jgi:hypothetical protein